MMAVIQECALQIGAYLEFAFVAYVLYYAARIMICDNDDGEKVHEALKEYWDHEQEVIRVEHKKRKI